jgi:hypothetical protein
LKGEEDTMERKEIIEVCGGVSNLFEPAISIDSELSLIAFLTYITEPKFNFLSDLLHNVEDKLEGTYAVDVLTDLWTELSEVAFGLGFTLGSLVEPVDPIIEEKIESIRKIIKDAAFVPFVPRQRRAA